jgi:peptide/nickel transport system ATP-binding protein
MKNILEVHDLSINYLCPAEDGEIALNAVDNISFKLDSGRSLGLVGESGCGKTTVMLALMRLLPEAGRIVDGRVDFMGQDISMIFQGAMNSLNPVRTVENQIIEAILRHGQAGSRSGARKRSRELLELVGINPNRGKQYPHQYSGGMRQRAIIAMALSCNPKILVADEPTTALDVMIQAQITKLLKDLQEELGLTLILVTHDLGVVSEICDDVLVMYGGKVAEYGTSDTIYNIAKHPYTRRLLKAFPDIDNLDAELVSIPGVPPRLDDLPEGCRFNPRCHLSKKYCMTDQPPLTLVGENHFVACHMYSRK